MIKKLEKVWFFVLLVPCLFLGFSSARSEDLSSEQAAAVVSMAVRNLIFPARAMPFSLRDAPMTFSDKGGPCKTDYTHTTTPSSGQCTDPKITVDPLDNRAIFDKQRDRPASYFLSFKNGQNSEPVVGLARINKINIMELKKISQNEYRLELHVGYDVTSLGTILFGRSMQLEREEDALLKLHDDGWRLQFLKRF